MPVQLRAQEIPHFLIRFEIIDQEAKYGIGLPTFDFIDQLIGILQLCILSSAFSTETAETAFNSSRDCASTGCASSS